MTTIMPCGLSISDWIALRSRSLMPRCCSSNVLLPSSSSRITTFSPPTVGIVLTRKFTLRAGFLHAEVAVLRPAVFGGVHVGHDFDAGDDGFFDVVRNRHHGLQLAVDAVANSHFGHVRLEVNVARVGVDGAHQDRADQPDHRGLLLFFGSVGGQLFLDGVFGRFEVRHFHVDDRLAGDDAVVEAAVERRLHRELRARRPDQRDSR